MTTAPPAYIADTAEKAEIVAAEKVYLSKDARHSLIWAAAHTGENRADCIRKANTAERNHRLREGIERHTCTYPGCDAPQEIAGMCLADARAHYS